MKLAQNLSKDEKEILRRLKQDDSIIICAADKGKAIVIENKETYLEKMQAQLDEGDYCIINRKEDNIVNSIHRKLVTKLFDMGLKADSKYRKYTMTAPQLATMYLLIKVHKKGFPARAVVSQSNDPTYKICSELTQILNPLDEKGKSFIRDSYHLKNMLKDIKLNPTHRIASLDVKSLYPSIPLHQALEITKEELMKDETLDGRTKWKPDDIIDLLKISLETHFKTTDGRIFKQTDGTPIGKSISGPLAGIYMNWYEEEYVYKNELFKPTLWKRMRDDVLLIYDEAQYDLDDFVSYLNERNNRIQFTVEKENQGSIPFLDLLIMRNQDHLTTKVYRKDTHTQSYINWKSNHPKNILLGTLKGLIHRAHQFCDLKEDLLEELNLLHDVFIVNGYPAKLVKQTIDDSWKREIEKDLLKQMKMSLNMDEKQEESGEYYNVLHAPYVPSFTEKLQRDLRKLNIGFVPKKRKTIQTETQKKSIRNKDTTEQKDLVYWISCQDCDRAYIGETAQKLKTRIKQHQNDIRKHTETNGLFQHVKTCLNHHIDWQGALIIDREPNWESRKLKEAIYINAVSPKENKDLMNLEKGKEISPIWNTFNEEIKKGLNAVVARHTTRTSV